MGITALEGKESLQRGQTWFIEKIIFNSNVKNKYEQRCDDLTEHSIFQKKGVRHCSLTKAWGSKAPKLSLLPSGNCGTNNKDQTPI
jgi:hypothetical protein